MTRLKRHTDHLSTRIKVETHRSVILLEQMRLVTDKSRKQTSLWDPVWSAWIQRTQMTDLNQLIQMKPRWHTGEALCATTVSSIYINIYHGFTVVTLTKHGIESEMWAFV